MDAEKMDFSFVIPSKKEDLFNSNGKAYRVNKAYEAKDIQGPLTVAGKAFLTSDDPFYLFDYFDVFFSVIENVDTMSRIVIFKSMDLLTATNKKMDRNVADFLRSKELDEESRKAYLNLTKMMLYLINEMVRAIDHLAAQATSADFVRKKSKKQTQNDDEFQNWGPMRYRIMVNIFNLIQHPLERLWDPPLPEEDFVNMVCDSSYRTLELPYIKEKMVNETVFQILATCIKRYNHAMDFPVKTLAILGSCEISVSPIAAGMALLEREYGITTIVPILIKELVETMSVDTADQQRCKFFSQFLSDLCATDPKIILPHLQELADELLNNENHVVRNTVLQMIGDVIVCELTSPELTQELRDVRDDLLERILDHMMDISAHVRSKVLQIWNHMKEENAVPLAWQSRVLMVAVERLEDKTSVVRKNAVGLIKSFLERNPFAANLSKDDALEKYKEALTKLDELRTKMVESAEKVSEVDEAWNEMTEELSPIIREKLENGCPENDKVVPSEDFQHLLQRICDLMDKKEYTNAVNLMIDADYLAHKNDEIKAMDKEKQTGYYLTLLRSYLVLNTKPVSHAEFDSQEATVNFLRDSIQFSKIIIAAVPKIQLLLRSKANSDVFEAIDFFTTGFMFKIRETEQGMRDILFLVWSADKEKRDAVTRAYKKILFTTDKEGRAHAVSVVKNLCNFFTGLTVGQHSALEVLVKEWVDEGDIDHQIITVLFERFTKKLEDTTDNESRQALELLIMTTASNPKIATANLDIVVQIGFDEIGLKDPRIFTQCLRFLMALEQQSNTTKYYKRYPRTHSIIQKIIDGLQKFFENVQLVQFEAIAKASFDFIYHMAQAPDIICQDLIKHMCKRTGELAKTNAVEGGGEPTTSVSTVMVSRILFVVGYAAIKEMIFLDIDIYNNMKYRQQLKDEKDNQKQKKNKKSMNKRKTVSLNMSASDALKRRSGTNADNQEEEDIVMCGSAEDNIAELCNHICEEELLYAEDSLLKRFVPIMEDILKRPGVYSDKRLQQSACLALTRFMTISSKFCEVKMPFLMNILDQTDNIVIKTNIVIGLSDLTFRFPNVIEPWTGHLYSTLHESNDDLRLAAVKMLAHLILHEMIRVKGQISDLAMCIVDPNEEIRNITQQFFLEISSKVNILYNVLPDIISRLSDPKVNLEEVKYQCIMKYIMGLIQKDRQIESLVEKLCLRFRVTFVERQWRDIAYCLSLLNYTERSVKKLMENVQNFKDKLHVEEVMAAFKTIISNASKLAKPEMKALLAEFEQKLEECLKVRDDADENADVSKVIEERPKTKKPANRRGKKKPVYSDSDDDEAANTRRTVGVRKGAQKTIVDSDSSDESPEKTIKSKRGRKK